MRPRGTFGEVGRALLSEAQRQPGTVKQLAERAQVGYHAAASTASRYVQGGQLVRVGGGRPAVLAVALAVEAPAGDAFLILSMSLWQRQAAAAPEAG